MKKPTILSTAAVLSIKLAPNFAEAVKAGFIEKGAALSEAARRRQLYRDGCAQCDLDEAELKLVSKDLLPTDDAGIVRAATLKIKVELWPNRKKNIEGDVFRAEGKIQEAEAKIKTTIADAASQIAAERKAFVCRLLQPLGDEPFADWAADRCPLVTEAQRFVRMCSGDLGLPLEEIAAIVLSGTLPPLPPPNDSRPAAAMSIVGSLPLPSY